MRTPATIILLLLCMTVSQAEPKLINDLPPRAETIKDFSAGVMMAQMSELALHRIEGVWQFPSTGVELAIIRENVSLSESESRPIVYRMIIVSSPDRAIRPGTVMGLITPAAKSGEYDANIYTKNIGSLLTIPKKFSLALADNDSSLEFKKNRSAFSVNLWRLLPYLWRYTIHPNRPTPESDGCIRIFPDPPLPREPIYL